MRAGSVDLYGSGQDIASAASAFVGESVRRSGRTLAGTSWCRAAGRTHSGTVQAVNATITYAEGRVSGLIRTNVCGEPGDSGGSLFDGSTAIGPTAGGDGSCTPGGTPFLRPVTEALSVYQVHPHRTAQ